MKVISPRQMKNGVHDDCSKNFLHSSELPMNGGFTALYPNEFGHFICDSPKKRDHVYSLCSDKMCFEYVDEGLH